MALHGLDGTSLRVADSEENVLQYGRPQAIAEKAATRKPAL